MTDEPNPFDELKGNTTFYFIMIFAIFSIIGIAIYLSSCTSFYDDSELDEKIQVEIDGQLYSVKRL